MSSFFFFKIVPEYSQCYLCSHTKVEYPSRVFLVTMVPNKESRHGNILMCYFWRGVLVYLEKGWDSEASEGSSSSRGCLWLRWHVGNLQPSSDAEPSAEQTGSCCRVFPVPTTPRQTGATFRFNKVERVWGKQARSRTHANSLLTRPLCLPRGIPTGMLGDQRLRNVSGFSWGLI